MQSKGQEANLLQYLLCSRTKLHLFHCHTVVSLPQSRGDGYVPYSVFRMGTQPCPVLRVTACSSPGRSAAEVLLPLSTSPVLSLELNRTSKTQWELREPSLTAFLPSDHKFSFSGQDPQAIDADRMTPMDFKGLWIQTFHITVQLNNRELHGMKSCSGWELF